MFNIVKSGFYLFLWFCATSLSYAQSQVQPQSHPLQIAKLGKNNNSEIYSPKIRKNASTSWEELTDEFIMSYSHGDYNQAHLVAQKALNFSRRVYGNQHQNTADAFNKLGIASEAMHDLDTANRYYENALTLFESSLGKKNAKVAMVLNNLGNLFFLKTDYNKAEELHLKSLLMRQHLFSSLHPTVARSAYNLGKLYEKQSKHTDAIMFYKQAAVLWKKTLGPNNQNIANTFNNLGNIYAAKGNNASSEEYHLKALGIREEALGPDSLEVAESLLKLGTICTKQEKYDEAESFYQKALGIMEKILDVNDSQIAMALYSLANIYHIQAQQEYIYNQELTDRINTSNTITIRNTTASNKNNIIIFQLRFRKKYVGEIFSKAEPLYQRAINIIEKKLGAKHPSVTVMKDELAMLYANIKISNKK